MLKKFMVSVTVSFIFFTLVAPLSARAENRLGPYTVTVENNIFTDTKRESRSINTDVYLPSANEETLDTMPLIIYSHGVMSNKSEMKSLLLRIASYGYRILSSDAALPNETSDLNNKFLDITYLFEKFNAKPSNTIIMGYSLGSLAAIKAGDIHIPALVWQGRQNHLRAPPAT